MSRPPILNGVCIKVTPEVENFLFSLDECRNYLVQLKISASKDLLIPGEQYTVQVQLGKDHHVKLTCVGNLAPSPEIMVLFHEEVRLGSKFPIRKIAAACVTTTLITMELMYYGGHNIPAITRLFEAAGRAVGL